MTKTYDLSLTLVVDEIQAEPRAFSIIASAEDCSNLVQRFKLLSLENLEAKVTVQSAGKETIQIDGHVTARLEQPCTVSLEPVDEVVDEEFSLLMVPPEVADRMDGEEVYLNPEAPDYDALEGDTLPLGDIVAQTLSVMMNPYPKKEDAVLKPSKNMALEVNGELETKPNPFAVLSKLRDES
jgi:uncharacterized metal-binding protein YceD (DUF177 family)